LTSGSSVQASRQASNCAKVEVNVAYLNARRVTGCKFAGDELSGDTSKG
jgi:hypothetical protein